MNWIPFAFACCIAGAALTFDEPLVAIAATALAMIWWPWEEV